MYVYIASFNDALQYLCVAPTQIIEYNKICQLSLFLFQWCVYSLYVCVGCSLHPQPSDFASQSNLEAYYLRLRADHLQSKMAPVASATVTFTPPPGRRDPGPPPPPPDLQPIIDKTAEYVARNSEGFERTVLERHCGDPKFGFLNPWDQYYPYYKFRLHMNKEKAAEEALAAMKSNRRQRGEAQWGKQVQKLSHIGSVSFKLTPKKKRTVLETGVVDLGPPAEDEEEEEEEGDNPVIMQQEGIQNVYVGGRGGEEDDLYGADGGAYQTVVQMYYGSGHAHYTSEGMAYSGNGELVEEGEGAPPTKRAKKNADIAVMDNKVQVSALKFVYHYCSNVSFLSTGIPKSSKSCIGHLA